MSDIAYNNVFCVLTKKDLLTVMGLQGASRSVYVLFIPKWIFEEDHLGVRRAANLRSFDWQLIANLVIFQPVLENKPHLPEVSSVGRIRSE